MLVFPAVGGNYTHIKVLKHCDDKYILNVYIDLFL